jgi:hypothetical protein
VTCKKWKFIIEFLKVGNNYRITCNSCRNIYIQREAEYVKEQKQIYSEYIIKWNEDNKYYSEKIENERQEKRKQKEKEWRKGWYSQNKKRLTELKRLYYQKNKKRYLKNVKIWRKNNPDKVLKTFYNRIGYGYKPINKKFESSHAHHLHIEDRSDFVIFIPNFLHQLHSHRSKNPESMITPNALALDFWINEKMYYDLYEIKK